MNLDKLINKKTKFIGMVVLGAIILVAIVLLIIFSPSGKTEISVVSLLSDIDEIADISTVEYTYNSVAEKKNEKETEYYVSYKGTAKVGFDFDKIEITESVKDEKIIVTIPELEYQEFVLDDNGFDYIFTKSKYKKDVMIDEVIKLCKDHLEKNARESEALKKIACENALETVKGIVEPFKDVCGKKYVIEYVLANEIKAEQSNQIDIKKENIVKDTEDKEAK